MSVLSVFCKRDTTSVHMLNEKKTHQLNSTRNKKSSSIKWNKYTLLHAVRFDLNMCEWLNRFHFNWFLVFNLVVVFSCATLSFRNIQSCQWIQCSINSRRIIKTPAPNQTIELSECLTYSGRQCASNREFLQQI